MKAPPLLLGGSSPVVAYLRHSMMVCRESARNKGGRAVCGAPTVLPDPLYPTISVSGEKNCIVSLLVLSKDRMLHVIKDPVYGLNGQYSPQDGQLVDPRCKGQLVSPSVEAVSVSHGDGHSHLADVSRRLCLPGAENSHLDTSRSTRLQQLGGAPRRREPWW